MALAERAMSRARAYVRESTVEQGEKFGPDAQRAAIARACTELRLTQPDRWYTDLVSGTGKVLRDELARARTDARAREYDVLLCYDTSRWARNERDAFNFEAEMHRAGVRVYYVAERIWSDDPSEGAAIAKGVFHVLNAQYSRTLGRKVRDGYAAKFDRLGIPGGTVPWGYRFDDKGRTLVPTEDARIRALALELYATGRFSSRSLAAELNRRGHRIYGRPFTQWSIVEILRNPIAIGTTRRYGGRAGEVLRDGVVAPIVDRQTWARCLELRSARRVTDTAPRVGVFVFGRIGFHSCGERLSGYTRRSTAAARALVHRCSAPFNRDEEPFERAVSEWISRWKLDPRRRARLAAFLRRRHPDLEKRRSAVDRRLARAKELFLLGDLSDSEYAAERSSAQNAIVAIPNADAGDVPIRRIEDLARAWPKAPLEARRALVEELCDRVVFGDGTMELVVRDRYRTLVAAVAEPFASFVASEDHVGRGRPPKKDRQVWARRDSNPHALSSTGP
jgi:DNA invertase Pin-like site-specific DNA recombinase